MTVTKLLNLPLEKVLSHSLRRGGQFADLFYEIKTETTLSFENDKLEKVISGTDAGLGIRVIDNFHAFYAYTNVITESSLMALAAQLSEMVALSRKPLTPPRISPLKSYAHTIKIPPEAVALDAKTIYLEEANVAARSFDKRIHQVKIIYRDEEREILTLNSLGEQTTEKRVQTVFLVHVVANDGQTMETGYEMLGGIKGLELLDGDSHIRTAETAAQRAVTMLEAPFAPKGEMTVVLSSEAGGTMIHEAIGHGLEADLAQQGLSRYSGKMGETVASPLITVIDNPTLKNRRGSYHVDDEGTPSQKTILVEKGVLKSYMYDRLSAMKDKTQSTGNGRRQSYRYRPIPRMSNTYIAPGETDPAEIIESLKNGLLVKKMGGGQVDTVNGDFVFEISEAYKIENGKVLHPVRGATLIGNGPKILSEIDLVGNDLGFAIGTCGKDGQGVPVSDAQPTLRIPTIIVGGRS
ncbi:MAG: TldD/PmbA family protein [Deltaproteobacteria bacterium]|nr:TldD/PmbA family protein [Deltaproteobacteria bacterium]